MQTWEKLNVEYKLQNSIFSIVTLSLFIINTWLIPGVLAILNITLPTPFKVTFFFVIFNIALSPFSGSSQFTP